MSIELEEVVQDHDKRITSLEINSGRTDERLGSLVRATENLKKSTWCFSLIMLLTIVYLLLGRQWYKDVTGTLFTAHQTVESIADNEVWLGKLDSPDNQHEITPEEKAAIEKQREEELEQLREQRRNAS